MIDNVPIGPKPHVTGGNQLRKRVTVDANKQDVVQTSFATQSVEIINHTNCWVFLDLGGPVLVSNNQIQYDAYVKPYTMASFPTDTYIFGYYIVQNRLDPRINNTLPGDTCTITAFGFPRTSYVYDLGEPPISKYGQQQVTVPAATQNYPLTAALIKPRVTKVFEVFNLDTSGNDILIAFSGDGSFALNHSPLTGYADFNSIWQTVPSGGAHIFSALFDLGWQAIVWNTHAVNIPVQLIVWGYDK